LILVDPTKIRKVDLNFADWKELARHPYIQKALAEKIVKFRSRFGSINEPGVLLDQMVLTPGEYERLRPYL
jgi:DNA uptake protein ComE-like DNA-binding protein